MESPPEPPPSSRVPSPVSRWARSALVVFVLQALTLTLFATIVGARIDHRTMDQVLYRSIAQSLAEGSGFQYEGHPYVGITPGYPAYVSLHVLAGGDHAAILVLVTQALLLALTALAAGDLARMVGLSVVAQRLTQVVVGFFPLFVFSAQYINTETLFDFLVVLQIWLALRLMTMPLRWSWSSAAICTGAALAAAAAVAVRPTGLLVTAAIALACLVLFVRRPRMRRSALLTAAVVLLGAAAFSGAWSARTSATIGRPVFLSTEGSGVAFLGNAPQVSGHGSDADIAGLFGKDVAARVERMSEEERERFWSQKLKELWKTDPWGVLGLWPAKMARLWLNLGYPDPPSRASILVAAANGLVLALSIPGLVFVRRRGDLGLFLAVCTVTLAAFLTVLHLLTFALVRYSMPVMPLLILMACGSLAPLRRRIIRLSSEGPSEPSRA